MRTLLGLLLLLALAGCDECIRPKEDGSTLWTLHDDKMNFGVVLVDRDTRELLGGNVSHFDLCSDCGNEEWPVTYLYSRGEVSRATFFYEENDAILFEASTGGPDAPGAILFPDTMLAAQYFKRISGSTPYPDYPQYLELGSGMSLEAFKEEARGAWDAIDDLDVVAAFAERPHTIGFYLYRWGFAQDEDGEAWVIFLYAMGMKES